MKSTRNDKQFAIFALVMLLGFVFILCTITPTQAQDVPTRLLNQERVSRDLPHLESSARLSRHAVNHSERMAFDAESSIFFRPYLPTKRLRPASVAAGDTLDEIVAQIRRGKYLLDPRFTRFGVGVARSTDGRYWLTVLFR